MAEPGKPDEPWSKENSSLTTPKQQPNTPTIGTNSTGPHLVSATQQPKPRHSPPRSPAIQGDKSEGQVVDKPKECRHEQQLSHSAKANMKESARHKRSASHDAPSSQSTTPAQARSSHDGSSYVHKQRMYQQQRSIAGFEEQQAIEAANDLATDLAAEYEALLSGKLMLASERGRTSRSDKPDALGIVQAAESKKVRINDSSVSSAPRHRSHSPRTETSSTHQQSRGPSALSQYSSHTDEMEKEKEKEQKAAKIRASLQAVQEIFPSKPQTTGFRRDKILGFRRRAKEPPAFISVPYNIENQVVAIQSAPLDAPHSEESSPKRSKIERIFGEPRPSFAESKDRRRSPSLARNVDAPQPKATQSHSRTRTSSSTVLNDNLSSPKALSKSKTEPSLTPTAKSAKQPSLSKDAPKPQSKEQPKVEKSAEKSAETKVKRPRNKSSDPLKDTIQESKSTSAKKSASATEKAIVPATSIIMEAKPTKQTPAEVIVASETGDGLVRKASLTRPRSNPQLQTQTTAMNSLPSLDFLPQLKHQPLVKKDHQSPTRASQTESNSVSTTQLATPIAPVSSQSPLPGYAPDLKLIPRSPFRPPPQFPLPSASRHNRSATDVGTLSSFGKGALAEGLDAKPVAKLFVICCKCKFWHDLPSKLYEAMSLPKELHKAEQGKLAGARLETAVRCPWCEHAMTTFCCQGWTTVVYLHERHH